MTAGESWSNPIWYGKYRIYQNDFTAHPDWAQVSWLYCHDDYDGAPDGGDHRAGACSSVEQCKQEIDWLNEDDQDYCEECGTTPCRFLT